MSEQAETKKEFTWESVEPGLLRVIIAAFTDNVGEEPGNLSPDDFLANMDLAFPKMPHDRASIRLGSWGARNVIISQMNLIDPQDPQAPDSHDRPKLTRTTTQLAELSGGDHTSLKAAEHIVSVMGRPEMSEARPMLKLLSHLALEKLQ